VTACRQLAPETKSKLEQEEQAPCEEAILQLDLPAGDRFEGERLRHNRLGLAGAGR